MTNIDPILKFQVFLIIVNIYHFPNKNVLKLCLIRKYIK